MLGIGVGVFGMGGGGGVVVAYTGGSTKPPFQINNKLFVTIIKFCCLGVVKNEPPFQKSVYTSLD